MSNSNKPNPLPLSETLRDLALLRAADLDLSTLLPSESTSAAVAESTPAEESTARSYEFVKEGRVTVRLLDRGEVDKQGARVDDIRSELEGVLKALDEGAPS
jgi:hypothetical protein